MTRLFSRKDVCSLKVAHGKGQPTGPRGEVPKWTYIPNPASKIGSWHIADPVLPPVVAFRGQLCSRVCREVIGTNRGYPGHRRYTSTSISHTLEHLERVGRRFCPSRWIRGSWTFRGSEPRSTSPRPKTRLSSFSD